MTDKPKKPALPAWISPYVKPFIGTALSVGYVLTFFTTLKEQADKLGWRAVTITIFITSVLWLIAIFRKEVKSPDRKVYGWGMRGVGMLIVALTIPPMVWSFYPTPHLSLIHI